MYESFVEIINKLEDLADKSTKNGDTAVVMTPEDISDLHDAIIYLLQKQTATIKNMEQTIVEKIDGEAANKRMIDRLKAQLSDTNHDIYELADKAKSMALELLGTSGVADISLSNNGKKVSIHLARNTFVPTPVIWSEKSVKEESK